LEELGVADAFRRLEVRLSHLHRIRWAGKTLERPALSTRSGATHHLDRGDFDDMLLTACEQRGLLVKRSASLMRLVCTTGHLGVELNDAGARLRVECAAVIDATGRSARACRWLDAKRERADRLVAFAATFERGDCEPSSLVESSPDGWWYSAPRPGGSMTAMYVTELLDPGERNLQALWHAALAQTSATRARLEGRTQTSSVRAYRAGPEWTHFDPEAPVLPVGDAALSLDPISGEGLCFALRSGLEAAKALGSVSMRRAYREGARGVYESHLREREAGYALERSLRASMFWRLPRHSTSWCQASSAVP
jgi:flavin-dependent dehydrogenase